MAASSHIVIVVAGLAFCCWAVQLGGIASLNAACNSVPDELGAMLAGGQGTAAEMFQVVSGYYQFSGVPTANSCSQQFSFQWWIIVAEFLLIVGMVVALDAPTLLRLRGGFIATLAVLTTINWLFAARYSNLVWSTKDVSDAEPVMYRRLQVTLAGYIMVGIANLLWCFALSLFENDGSGCQCNKGCCGGKKEPVGENQA